MGVNLKQGYFGTPPIVRDGLKIYLDPANTKSYVSGASTLTDISGNLNSGSLTGTYGYSSANAGYLISTLSTNNINTPYTQIGADNTTQIIWYNWNGVNQGTYITYIGTGAITNGIALCLSDGTSNNNFPIGSVVTVGVGNISGINIIGPSLVANTWIQLAVTRDTTTNTLYQNGKFVGSTTSTPGNQGTTETYSVRGIVGGVGVTQFYNRALTATEVAQNYNALKTRYGLQ
jgi:hypothetical protein